MRTRTRRRTAPSSAASKPSAKSTEAEQDLEARRLEALRRERGGNDGGADK